MIFVFYSLHSSQCIMPLRSIQVVTKGKLSFILIFVAASYMTPLSHLALKVKEACALDPMRLS